MMDENITIGEKYGPAMKITDSQKAKDYFELCVKHSMMFGHSREKAEEIEKSNLGYFAGYYDDETRLRVEKLFCCVHPIFGPISQGKPTAEEAFKLDMELANPKHQSAQRGLQDQDNSD